MVQLIQITFICANLIIVLLYSYNRFCLNRRAIETKKAIREIKHYLRKVEDLVTQREKNKSSGNSEERKEISHKELEEIENQIISESLSVERQYFSYITAHDLARNPDLNESFIKYFTVTKKFKSDLLSEIQFLNKRE